MLFKTYSFGLFEEEQYIFLHVIEFIYRQIVKVHLS